MSFNPQEKAAMDAGIKFGMDVLNQHAEWEKLLKLGGSEWLRDKIRRAKLPE